MADHEYGITLENGSRIVHGTGANIKVPFQDLGFPVEMHELSAGSASSTRGGKAPFAGQFGFIEFDTSIRLPMPVHIAPLSAEDGEQRFVCERILVLSGVALVEMNGEVDVIPPKSLVTIAPGVPNTWTACPAEVEPLKSMSTDREGQGVVSDGRFLMIYEYEEPTGFFPTKQTQTLQDVKEYVRCPEDQLNDIRIKEMSGEEVLRSAWFVWDTALKKVSR
jgi:hypothetical protein